MSCKREVAPCQGLRDEQTVKRIVVMERLTPMGVNVRHQDGEQQNIGSIGPGGQQLLEGFRQSQFSQRILDADFPKGRGADKQRVLRILNARQRRCAELATAREEPKQRMGVQNRFHGRSSANSASGASKSAASSMPGTEPNPGRTVACAGCSSAALAFRKFK